MEKNEINLKSPKITVITPTYNRANFIAETIESVLNQDFKDFEYLILDDGSTDNTEEVVKPYLKDERVKYLKHENVGEAETVNWGWSLAKGEYFSQVNSDDPILPGLFSEMVKALDKRKDVVVAYPDFYFTDEKGKIMREEPTPDWNFLDAISAFSCYAASAGTFIRKSAFSDWKKIRGTKFKYINDIEMYWKMALKGNFLHVPKFLATWRSHSTSISAERYKCIPEVHLWFKDFFAQSDLPHEILMAKEKIKRVIDKYCIHLLKKSNLENKNDLVNEYYHNHFYRSENLQISDNDLIGNKFNGHNLHLYLRNIGIDSKQLVWNKESDDDDTFEIARSRNNREEIYNFSQSLQRQYSLDGTLNPIAYDILFDPLFLDTRLTHLHLIHNHIFDIQLLPLLSRLKPIVWTLHDPWPLSGHCIQHFECNKWKTGCSDCGKLSLPFEILKDNSTLNYSIKKQAIQNSNVEIIVASKHMLKKLEHSPIFRNKRIHLIPFGIDQKIFRPKDKLKIRKKLDIPQNMLIISYRGDNNYKKGLDYIDYVSRNLKTNNKICFLVLGGGNIRKIDKHKYIEYEWIKDDQLMADIYNASDLFLMPSTVESFGMMAIEAMSCGTLPIVLEGTALPEVINAPECGVSVKKDKDEYLKTVQYYIDHEEEREMRAQKCLEFAKKRYNKDVYVSKLIEMYKEVIANHKLSEEDQRLLNQLKKHMIIEPAVNMELITSVNKHVSAKPTTLKRFLTSPFYYRLKEIIPKKTRTAVRNKIRILNKL